jgi:hypothetical protein
MKRQILCPECAKRTRALFPTDNPYPGEHVRFVVGNAKMVFVCDTCNKELRKNAPCVAVSMWHEDRNPWYAWEQDYIIPVDEREVSHGDL